MKQPQDNRTTDLEDIFIWPDTSDVYYYRYEVDEELIRFKGEDYSVLYFGTDTYADYFTKYYT